MIEYFVKHSDKFLTAFLEHLWIVIITLLISLMIAAVLSLALLRLERLGNLVMGLFGAIYSIPSLALFAMLIPVTGLGMQSAVIVLVLYNQYLLLRNILTGMKEVDKSVLEAATGMGMSYLQVVTKVQLPLAFPSVIAGIRLAIISTTGIATIAAAINAGGLGALLFAGLRTMNLYKILWATILCILIALSADLVLKRVEKKLRIPLREY